MNIVNKLTIRHLKQNKKRTLVTIIGTIISVAMITAVATLAISFIDLMQRQMIADRGEWHVKYQDVNKAQFEAIQQDEQTKAVVLSKDIGYANLDGADSESKPYLFIRAYNASGFKKFPITLTEGRLPKEENEVVISEEIAAKSGVTFELGEHITLEVGDRKLLDSPTPKSFMQHDPLQMENGKKIEAIVNKQSKTYTVVGFIKRPKWEPTWAPGYTVLSYVDGEQLTAGKTANAFVIVKNVKASLYDHANQLAQSLQIKEVGFNNDLLRLYGVTDNDNLRRMMFSLAAIIMSIIVIGSISLIYNAFGISVSERSRHLGMLASVGATKKQKRNSVFFEGVIIGLISIPIGFAAGLIGIQITFMYINSMIQGALGVTESLTVVVTPMLFMIASAISFVTIMFSAFFPAWKASKISAIDAIRQTDDVRLTGKRVKTSKLVRKLFGMEAEIGLKNLKRNKRRYRVTVFSLVISIFLFLTVSFFTDNMKKSYALSQNGINYDIQVYKSGQSTDLDESFVQTITNLEYVTADTEMKATTFHTWIEKEAIATPLQDEVAENPDLLENDKYRYTVEVRSLDDKSFREYTNRIGIDLDPSLKLPAILMDKVTYMNPVEKKYMETKSIYMDVGQSLELYPLNLETNGSKLVNKINIAGLTNERPMGLLEGNLGGIQVIVPESVFHQLVQDQSEQTIREFVYLNSSDPMATQAKIEEVKGNYVHLFNVYRMRQQEEQMILILSVFSYGFIVLITLISIANILNTISTGISLRKREFAMLKSVGMTPKSFNKMINYESIFYGVKSLLFGIPISIAVMYFIYRSLMNTFSYKFSLPWTSMGVMIVAVFLIVGAAMLYSISKVRKENIIETLKHENI